MIIYIIVKSNGVMKGCYIRMRISEVSKKYGLTQETLRYYEKEGLIGPVKKDKSGIRDYDENDLKRIEFVKCMRNAELSIDVLKKYIDLYEKGEDTKEERKRLLIEQKKLLDKKIKTMKKASMRLEYKIRLYCEGRLDEYLGK